jgi:hypothetical protein
MWLLKYVLNCENSIFHFSYFGPDYPISGLTATELSRLYATLRRVSGRSVGTF